MIRGKIWWADLGIPYGIESGFKRPVIVIKAYSFNRSKIQAVIFASITTKLNVSKAPENVLLKKEKSGLSKNGVVNLSQLSTILKEG